MSIEAHFEETTADFMPLYSVEGSGTATVVPLYDGVVSEADDDIASLPYEADTQAPLASLESEGRYSRALFDEAMALRKDALEAREHPLVEGEALTKVQESVRQWLETTDHLAVPDGKEERLNFYTGFDEVSTKAKIFDYLDYLKQNHADAIHPVELEATRAFVDSAYAMYQDQPVVEGASLADADGSFAFGVPARMGRTLPEYGEEVEPVLPAFRYMPMELRSQVMVGLPPFVIDTYKRDEDGTRGYLIYSPVNEDMYHDIAEAGGRGEALKAIRANVNAAVDFADRRLGVDVFGLGATLPAHTNYGKSITNPNVITTTGHGGTVELIDSRIKADVGENPEGVAIVGLGSIGASIAHIMADRFDGLVTIYDSEGAKIGRTAADNPGRFNEAASLKEVFDRSQVVISAVNTRISLGEAGIDSAEGVLIVDDSQPGSFSVEEVESKGGRVVWPIGYDATGATANRTHYDYGTLVDPQKDLFGCELEAASLSRYLRELRTDGMSENDARAAVRERAIRGPVDVEQARAIGSLFAKYSVEASQPQAFGEPVNL